MAEDRDSERKETRHRLEALLQELRVALPGVQMLFGFLLVVPFNDRFDRLGSTQRTIFFGVFAAALLSSIALIAPSAFHRIHMGHELHATLRFANRLALVGLAFLAVALVGSVHLITDVVFGSRVAVVATVIAAFVTLGAWLVAPLSLRPRGPERPRVPSPETRPRPSDPARS